jgi:iron complex outermembrane recepter protein
VGPRNSWGHAIRGTTQFVAPRNSWHTSDLQTEIIRLTQVILFSKSIGGNPPTDYPSTKRGCVMFSSPYLNSFVKLHFFAFSIHMPAFLRSHVSTHKGDLSVQARKSIAAKWTAGAIFVMAAILLIEGVVLAEADMILLRGSVTDPAGLGIPGVNLTMIHSLTGASKSAVSDISGQYQLEAMPEGRYRLTATYRGFAPYSREVILDKGMTQPLDIALQILSVKDSVTVYAQRFFLSDLAIKGNVQALPRASAGDTAQLLDGLPGVSLYGNGGVSSLPAIHGMADDRVRILVDGMDLISACPNHMNPPLSYIDPSRVGSVKVFAGITPASMGGDSIGGTISVSPPAPEFATPGQKLLLSGYVQTYYRSNGDGYGTNLQTIIKGGALSVTYNGSLSHSDNYRAGKAFKADGLAAIDRGWLDGNEIGSSRYESQNHALGIALRHKNHLVELTLGLQNIPYEGFPNQRMDMTRNDSLLANLHYTGQYKWGTFETRLYSDYTRHSMDFADDKQYFYGSAATILAPGMPMETKGLNIGGLVKANFLLSRRDTLRVGFEAQRYRLNDWWPPSPSVLPPGYTTGGMAPNTFISINNGWRDRVGVYAEWEATWNQQWISLLGIRSDRVLMNTGPVHGYNDTPMYNGPPLYPATAFNARNRKRTDDNLDLTALTRYAPGTGFELEAGYAMKTRSPNLYERYAWSTNTMAMEMINFAGDGNFYIGNLDLEPEAAHTFSATANWHNDAEELRGISITPYYTYVKNYIDARRCPATACGTSAAVVASTTATRGFVYLQFVNQPSELFGIDVSGHSQLARSRELGSFTATGTLGFVRGKNRTTGDNLYNIMPVNARLAVIHTLGRWTNTIEGQLVDSKKNLSQVRNEVGTEGYGLLNLRSSYGWRRIRIDAGLENVLNEFYAPPLGGAYQGQGPTMSGSKIPWGVPIAGMGRSLYISLTYSLKSE